jgi:alpha-amylase
MIDRVAHPKGDNTPHCRALDAYCGGTVAAVENKLPYLQKLGIDGVLISPLLQNMANGYHGYWSQNLSSMNTNFGEHEDVSQFIHSANEIGMFVAGDLNLNNFGRFVDDIPHLSPFNKSEFFHGCTLCGKDCSVEDYENSLQVEQCRLWGMPDLNHDHPFVRQTLKRFVRRYIDHFGFEALRLDAAKHIPTSFVQEIAEGAEPGGRPILLMPELFSQDIQYTTRLSGDTNSLTMNFPLWSQLREAFVHGTSMRKLHDVQAAMSKTLPEPKLLVNFLNTHDAPRFLALQPDLALYSNALAFTLCQEGLPLLLYGDEQDVKGVSDPHVEHQGVRVPLWHTGYDEESPRFQLIQKLLRLRPKFRDSPYNALHVDDRMIVFSRGNHFFVVSNFDNSSYQLPAQRVVYISEDQDLCKVKRFCDVLSSGNDCIEPVPYANEEGSYSGTIYAAYAGTGGANVACILRVEVESHATRIRTNYGGAR